MLTRPNKLLSELPSTLMMVSAILLVKNLAEIPATTDHIDANEPQGSKNKVGDLGVRLNEIEGIGLN